MPWRELDAAQWAKLQRLAKYWPRFRKTWLILRDCAADIARLAADDKRRAE